MARNGGHSEWQKACGERIRAARLANGWTLDVLSGLTGYTPASLSNLEHGRRGVSDQRKFVIAAALGRPVGDLFAWPEGIPQFKAPPQKDDQ